MTTTEVFLIAMAMVFALPFAVWRLLRTESIAPLVVVQIIAGVLLGPGALGAAYPDYYRFVFRPEVIMTLNGIAWWAVMMFVWLAGLELDLRQAWRHRGESTLVAACALLVPMALGGLAALALLAWGPGWIGRSGAPWQFVAGVGMACAVTALPILVLFLERLQVLRGTLGQRLLRYASFDDIAIWGVLALILLDWQRVYRQLGFLVCLLAVAWVFRRWMMRLSEPDRWHVALIWLICCAFLADWAGLHFMVGAFLAGVVLDAHWFDQQRLDQFRHQVLLSVMPVFFLSTGLRTNWQLGADTVFLAAALLLAVSVGGKLLGVGLAGRLLRWPASDARVVGWLLQTKGLIEIVFANVLLDKGIISSETFTALLLMAVASTVLTIPMVQRRLVPQTALPLTPLAPAQVATKESS